MTIVKTDVTSITGKWLYSDPSAMPLNSDAPNIRPALNGLATIPVIGSFFAIARIALGIIHSIAHLFAALFTLKKGHLFHAAKGACEILRGLCEIVPVFGSILYFVHIPITVKDMPSYKFWMMKIYNPKKLIY